MAIPPTNDLAADQIKLGEAIQAIGADVIGIQEVDEQLVRSGVISQSRLVAEAMRTSHWGFAPVIIGEPGSKWRKLDALDIKVFNRKCKAQFNCVITEKSGNLVSELTNKILKTAAVYEKQKKDKNFKPYIVNDPKN